MKTPSTDAAAVQNASCSRDVAVGNQPEHREVDRAAFGRRLLMAALFVLSFSVFGLSPITETSDSMYSMVLSESILDHFSTHLNWFHPPEPVDEVDSSTPPVTSATRTYQLGRVHGNLVYRYPQGSSILSLPFVALENLAGVSAVTADGGYNRAGDLFMQRALAAFLMAALVVLVFRTSLILLDTRTSLLIALAFGFGTQVWSSATRQLWSHTWLIFLEGWIVYLLLCCEVRGNALRAASLASLLSWTYFVRPTGAVPIFCVTIFVLLFHRREFIRFAVTGALWFAAFVAYSWVNFGDLIPGYYRSRLDFHYFWLSVVANLFSPSRGLFIYAPILGFVLYLTARHWSTIPYRKLATLSLAVIFLHLIAVAGYPCWWGGYCYGPRLMMDVLPWFALLAILVCAEGSVRRQWRSNPLELAVAIVLLGMSVGMNARGATSLACQLWSAEVSIDTHPERASDWSYPQFAAGLITPPGYARNLRLKSNSNAGTLQQKTASPSASH